MNKKITFFLIFLFIVNCSLDTKSGLWTKSKNLTKETNLKTKKLFVDKKILNKEFNKNLKIKLKGNYLKNKSYLSKSDLSLAILERLKDKKGFSTYKDKYDKRDDYNKNLYKYLSKTLDELPKTKDTKKLQHYKKEIGKLLEKLDRSNNTQIS